MVGPEYSQVQLLPSDVLKNNSQVIWWTLLVISFWDSMNYGKYYMFKCFFFFFPMIVELKQLGHTRWCVKL
jgi:hypothetical protein